MIYIIYGTEDEIVGSEGNGAKKNCVRMCVQASRFTIGGFIIYSIIYLENKRRCTKTYVYVKIIKNVG